MPVKETWEKYREINRLFIAGTAFADIAAQYDDSEEHISDFWQRFHDYKAAQKRDWDAKNKEHVREWTSEYRESRRDVINARARQDRIDNPERYKAYYQTKKRRAEEAGMSLYDPEYHRAYREENAERLRKQGAEYYQANRDKILAYQKQYYSENRDKVLGYHVAYQKQNRQARIDRLIAAGELPADWDENSAMSSYELMVKHYLDSHDIRYTQEKTFPGCVDRNKLRFDFYLNDYGILIEVDGQQHYRPGFFPNTDYTNAEKAYELTVAHDKIKTEYCKQHNIPLIRLPYYTIEDGDWQNIIADTIEKCSSGNTSGAAL